MKKRKMVLVSMIGIISTNLFGPHFHDFEPTLAQIAEEPESSNHSNDEQFVDHQPREIDDVTHDGDEIDEDSEKNENDDESELGVTHLKIQQVYDSTVKTPVSTAITVQAKKVSSEANAQSLGSTAAPVKGKSFVQRVKDTITRQFGSNKAKLNLAFKDQAELQNKLKQKGPQDLALQSQLDRLNAKIDILTFKCFHEQLEIQKNQYAGDFVVSVIVGEDSVIEEAKNKAIASAGNLLIQDGGMDNKMPMTPERFAQMQKQLSIMNARIQVIMEAKKYVDNSLAWGVSPLLMKSNLESRSKAFQEYEAKFRINPQLLSVDEKARYENEQKEADYVQLQISILNLMMEQGLIKDSQA